MIEFIAIIIGCLATIGAMAWVMTKASARLKKEYQIMKEARKVMSVPLTDDVKPDVPEQALSPVLVTPNFQSLVHRT